jgi:hypothetical protein
VRQTSVRRVASPIALNTMNSLYRPVASEIDGLILLAVDQAAAYEGTRADERTSVRKYGRTRADAQPRSDSRTAGMRQLRWNSRGKAVVEDDKYTRYSPLYQIVKQCFYKPYDLDCCAQHISHRPPHK